MKIRNQVWLCLAVSDFEVHMLLLSLCLTFQGTGLPVWKKFNSNVAANGSRTPTKLPSNVKTALQEAALFKPIVVKWASFF